jgi:hypothetical protein
VKLNGCINDSQNIRTFLVTKAGYSADNIIVLCDSTKNLSPTKKNILMYIDILVKKAVNEGFTEIWFSYSGHGSYVKDKNGDEKDQRDEVICPLDYSKSGFIDDDYIYANLITKIPSTTTLITLFDSCYSGTITDLPYVYDPNTKTPAIRKKRDVVLPGPIMCISGCMDTQTSCDACIQGKYSGALTWSFLKALADSKYNIKCDDLIKKMTDYLKQGSYDQVPVLSMASNANIGDFFMKK